ncbi:MAG: hypothetical protein M3R38_20990, partial [Actinomycetota bacterium]|nr:hypothetical protein [Actinomycetota bacterium]
MSETKPLTLSDLIKGEHAGVTMGPDGIIEVPPFNRAPNQYFRELTHRGMPRFWAFPVPPKKRGHYAYVSMPGYFPTKQGNDPPRKGTLSRQTNRPILMNQGSYVGNKPWVGEMSPIRSPIHAMPGLAKPLRPEVDVIASQLTGYRVVEGANTTYGFAFDLGDGEGGWTTRSGMATTVMAPEDSGKGFRFFVPPDTGEAVFLRIHQTKPNGGADTLRAQRIVPLPHPDGYVDLEGPYLDSGEAPQDENTTVLEAPTPDVTGDDADVFLARGAYGVRAGLYNFYYQLGDERGPGLLGPASEMVPVEGQIDNETDTENHTYHADEATNRININNNPFEEGQEVSPRAPAPDPLEGGKSYFVRDVAGNSFRLANTRGGPAINITENGSGTITGEVTREVQRDYVSNMAFHVRTPKGLAPGQRWTVWCFKVPFGGGTGTYMRLHRKRSTENIEELYGRNDRGDVRRDTFQIYGFSPESEPIALRNGLIEETPPTEDFTGLPNPDFLTPPEEPLVVELDTVETPADFLFAVSAVGYPGVVDRREESVVSEVVQKRILAGQTYRIIPRKSTNQLPNAEFTEVKSDHDGPFEVPADWTFTDGFPAAAPGDRRWFSSDGVGTINTNQTLSTGLYVHSKAYRLPGGSDVKVSVAATMSCDRWASGTTDLIVRQLDDEGNRLASNVILSLSSEGTVTTPEGGVQLGAGGDFPWADGVDKIIFRLKASDGTWNMKVDVQDLAIFPFEEAIRKVEEGEPGRPARPRPSPAFPYPPSSFVAIGLPPVPPGATTSTTPAVEVVDFENGIPGSWTVVEAPLASTDIAVQGTADGAPAIHGDRSLWVRDENRLKNSTLYVQRTYTDAAMGDSDSMAFRFLMLVEGLPTTPDYHRILTMAPNPVRPG